MIQNCPQCNCSSELVLSLVTWPSSGSVLQCQLIASRALQFVVMRVCKRSKGGTIFFVSSSSGFTKTDWILMVDLCRWDVFLGTSIRQDESSLKYRKYNEWGIHCRILVIYDISIYSGKNNSKSATAVQIYWKCRYILIL